MRNPDPHSSENARAAEEALRWMRDAQAERALLGEVSRTVRRRRHRLGAVLGTGAAIAIGVWIGFGTEGLTRWGTPGAPSPTATVFEPRRETLPDGSVAELRPDAEFAAEFTDTERRIVLKRGEAHFSVVKNPERPFVVTAPGVEVRAVGTSFSVGLGSESVEVVVTSGRVEVAQPSTTVPARLVDAGHQARLAVTAPDAGVKVEAISSAHMAERLAWRTPQIEFSRTPLSEAVALINARSLARDAMQIVADPSDAALRDLRLSGFLAADNVDGFLALLESSFGIRSEPVDGRTVRLTKTR